MFWTISRYFAEKRRLKRQTAYLYGRTGAGTRVLAALLCVLAVLAGIAFAELATAEEESVIAVYYVRDGVKPHLNGRARADKQSAIEAYFYAGDALEIVEIGAEWSRVRGGESGTVWVKNDYITPTAPDSEPKAYTVIGSGRVHVRDTPGGEHVRWAAVGDTVKVYGWAGAWAAIGNGYINGEFLAGAQ